MKIVYVLSPYYDYLTATLVEGLQELGHQVLASENSNYATKIPNKKLIKEAENADLIIVGSNQKVSSWLLDGIDNPNMVYVDGSDLQEIKTDPHLSYQMVFKRELGVSTPYDPSRPVFPLPFAAEKRYFGNRQSSSRDIPVSFAATLKTNPLRYSIAQRLQNLKDPRIFVGTTGERAYHDGRPVGLPIETPIYRDILLRSQIGVNVAGAGYDCARFWEIPAAGALLLTQRLDIQIPHPFVNGQHCLMYDTPEEFMQILQHIREQPASIAEIAQAGYEHCLAHHTTEKRATYFLETVANQSRDQALWVAKVRVQSGRKRLKRWWIKKTG